MAKSAVGQLAFCRLDRTGELPALRDADHPVIAGNADLGITMEDDDLVALMKGELNGMTAFMTGKLQIDGDLMLAQRLGSFFDPAKLG